MRVVAAGVCEGALIIRREGEWFYDPGKVQRLNHPKAAEFLTRLVSASTDERAKVVAYLEQNFKLEDLSGDEAAKALTCLIEL